MDLYQPKTYPSTVRARIGAMGPIATQVANRWMLGWPLRVKGLLETGEYLPELERQTEQERNAMAEPGLNHLSSWEKVEVMGLSNEAPFPSNWDEIAPRPEDQEADEEPYSQPSGGMRPSPNYQAAIDRLSEKPNA